MHITAALKGISGQYEAVRSLGAFGGVVYVVCANGFLAWAIHRGMVFSLTEYCTAFPGGLALTLGGISGAASLKDRNVAAATAKLNGAPDANA